MFENVLNFFIKKDKHFLANIVNANKTLKVRRGEKLLTAALENGIKWPHYCRVGSCGTCRCKLLEGKIRPLTDFGYVLDDEQLKEGYILACQSVLKSEIKVELDFKQKRIRRTKI
jgi:ferredoxin